MLKHRLLRLVSMEARTSLARRGMRADFVSAGELRRMSQVLFSSKRLKQRETLDTFQETCRNPDTRSANRRPSNAEILLIQSVAAARLERIFGMRRALVSDWKALGDLRAGRLDGPHIAGSRGRSRVQKWGLFRRMATGIL
jgi:hypothetical protein